MDADTQPTFSSEAYQKWYDKDISEVNQPMRKLLETYSKVPSEEVVPHVNDIRQRAFAVKPYPCIGQFRFLNLTLSTHPLYATILRRLKEDPSTAYLDLACCVGQDLRQLAADGVRHEQLTAVDIQAPFIDLGYDLFQDRSSLKAKFLLADIVKGSEQGQAWTDIKEAGADIMHCSAFLHLFSLADQTRIAKNIAQLIRPNGMLVGRQAGSIEPGEFYSDKGARSQFMHDVSTFRQMWDGVGRDTGTKWQVDGLMDMIGFNIQNENGNDNGNHRRLLFTVTRLE